MAFDTIPTQETPLIICLETQRAKRNALVDFYMSANFTGLSYHDTSAMIYKKVVGNFGTRVNIDPGLAMGPLGQHARNERNF